jgi:transcriptional regulator with XRE-family HTH domain
MPRKPGTRVRDYSRQPSSNQFGPQATDPYSPWQLLIEGIRQEKEITLRQLAALAQIPAGTLFNWVRAKSGAPSRSSYTSEVNARLSRALGVQEDKLAEAYNQSAFKPVDPQHPDPAPAPKTLESLPAQTVDALKRLLAVLKSTGRESYTLGEIELLAGMVISQSSGQAT